MIAIVLFANLGLQEVNGESGQFNHIKKAKKGEIKNKVGTIGAGKSNVERPAVINGQEWKWTLPNGEVGKSCQDLIHIITI